MTRFTQRGPDTVTYPTGRKSPDGCRYEKQVDDAVNWFLIVAIASLVLAVILFLGATS